MHFLWHLFPLHKWITHSSLSPHSNIAHITKYRCSEGFQSPAVYTPFSDWLSKHTLLEESFAKVPTAALETFLQASHQYNKKMATAHDQAVLQAIFNPNTPFGDMPDLYQEEDLTDDGKLQCWHPKYSN